INGIKRKIEESSSTFRRSSISHGRCDTFRYIDFSRLSRTRTNRTFSELICVRSYKHARRSIYKNISAKNIHLKKRQIEQFSAYYDLLVEWNDKINLTSITKKEDVYLKHFFDS